MPCNFNDFQHIEKILGTSVNNLVLQKPSKYQVDRTKIVRVCLSVYLLFKASDAKGCNVENKIFLGARHFSLYF